MPIAVGDSVRHPFVVDRPAMSLFQALSGDHSLIHTDAEYARSRGNAGVIAYGGIMLAKLSYVLGQCIPGTLGTSIQWEIAYRSPLYLDEPAEIRLEVVSVSKATGVVGAKFRIVAGERLIASGRTQSVVPSSEIADAG